MAKKNPPLSPVAESIRHDLTGYNAPRVQGGEPTRGTIFTPAGGWPNLLPPSEEPRGPQRTEYLEPQHANFKREFVGLLDQVDRSSSPGGELGIEVLESAFMGVDDRPSTTPLRSGQPMRARSSLKPSRIAHGSASTKGNRLDG